MKNVAEIIVSDLTGNERPKEKGLKSDGGWDVVWKGKNWDVKTEFRTVKFKKAFQHNVNGGQINNETEGYIFVSYNQSTGDYEICGWITKEKFLKFAEFKAYGETVIRSDGSSFQTKGKNGMYMIDHKYIKEFKNFKELVAVTGK